MDVQSVVSEKQNITVFDVITFHINGRMITKVYPCIIFYMTICYLISAFLIVFFTMLILPESHIQYMLVLC